MAISNVSICGIFCNECKECKIRCSGCNIIKGNVFWAEYTDKKTCLIHECCIEKKGFKHCGECEELPCRLYFDTMEPNATLEKHEEDIFERVEQLKKMKHCPALINNTTE